ncbi:hypothetical protein ACG02S_25135 [Roseateles sp. DC23W]|uniref:Phasin protein n=1 Tax=Pelomonas dachongensis TaxID=3299029 RepID=A0ABW7EV04_9BURK
MSHIVRSALMSHLRDLPIEAEEPPMPDAGPQSAARKTMKVSLTPAQALTLTARARAAVLAKGQYLASLMDGVPPPADSAGLIRALMSVADRLAAFSVDLNRFARHLEVAGSTELQGLPLALDAMRQETRGHMVLVSETLQQLTHTRTKR